MEKIIIAGFDVTESSEAYLHHYGQLAPMSELFMSALEKAKTVDDFVRLRDEYMANQEKYKDAHPIFPHDRETGDNQKDMIAFLNRPHLGRHIISD